MRIRAVREIQNKPICIQYTRATRVRRSCGVPGVWDPSAAMMSFVLDDDGGVDGGAGGVGAKRPHACTRTFINNANAR